jgi:hypothetical protein
MSEPPAGPDPKLVDEALANVADSLGPGVDQLLGVPLQADAEHFPWGHIHADHISEAQRERSKENGRTHWRQMAELGARVVLALAALGLLVFLVNRLADHNADLLKDILGKLFAFVGGLGLGIGGTVVYGRRKPEEPK